MNDLYLLKGCESHMHVVGAFYADDALAFGRAVYRDVNSNLRIGGVPDASHRPLHRFLDSGIKVVICSDDPGIFDITLASEVEWVQEHTTLDAEALQRPLGDPRHFQLGQQRIKGIARHL